MGFNAGTVSVLLFRTPMRDLLRGIITGRNGVERLIESSGLTVSAATCVRSTIQHARLWPAEQIEVAHELIAHFRDGIEADTPPDVLIASYGDIRRTAKLIRRAKLRQRPAAWHLLKWLRRSVVLLVLGYLLVLVRFMAGSPHIQNDYLATLNAETMAIPVDLRAWPLYRDALVTMHVADIPTREMLGAGRNPGSPGWEAVAEYLHRHGVSLDKLRLGAQKPFLGLPFLPLDEYSEDDKRALGITSKVMEQSAAPGLIDPLPRPGLFHTQALWYVIMPLTLDTRLAVNESDGDRTARNIAAMLLTFRQFQGPTHGIHSGYENWVIGTMRDLMTSILMHHRELLTDQQLRDLAHAIASTETRPEKRLRSLRTGFENYIQHLYTDDGRGDGRITPSGLRLLEQEHGEGFWLYGYAGDAFEVRGLMQQNSLHRSLSPLSVFFIASRRDILEKMDELNRVTAEELRQPLWINARSGAEAQIETWSYSNNFRYLPLTQLRWEYGQIKGDAEDFRGQKEGILVGIALELYRREYGDWPKTLEDLTPGYLPALPVDRLSGEPLLYRVTDSNPVVYSVGIDRDDDGGTPDYDEDNEGNPVLGYAGPRFYNGQGPLDDGDWILWPVPEAE